jgi:hypothetical protein
MKSFERRLAKLEKKVGKKRALTLEQILCTSSRDKESTHSFDDDLYENNPTLEALLRTGGVWEQHK